MSDVAQILGLAGPTNTGTNHASTLEQLKPTGSTPVSALRARTSTPTSISSGSKQKKLKGMQREVLELLESTHRANHALYPGFNRPSLQQKWKERKDVPAVKWLRKPFRNPARAGLAGERDIVTTTGDSGEEAGKAETGGGSGLVLTHWVKAHLDSPDYVFARFNVKCDVTKYTDEEYDTIIAVHNDPLMKWTKEETDVLMKLCQRFDLRWIVIADNYNTHPIAKSAYRSVEDIKYRYYEVTRLLAEAKERKIKEEQQDSKFDSKQEFTQQTSAITSDAASTNVSTQSSSGTQSLSNSYVFNIAYEKQRKRQLELAFTRSIEEENEIRRLNEELRGVEQQLKKVAVKVDTKKKKELADVPYEINRELPKGVFLRSSLLALPQQKHALSSKLVKKMELLLDELGVPLRPMPTKPVCEMYDSLRQEMVGLLTLRKHLAAKQAEAQQLRERYQTLTGQVYKPISTLIRRIDRRGDASASSNSTSSSANTVSPAVIHKGKSLKHSEKMLTSNKRRGSGGNPAIPSKRNKKIL